MICNRCKEDKPQTREFWYADKSTSTGLRQPCKECTKSKVRENYKENKEHYLAYMKEYREKNSEELYRNKSAYRFGVSREEIDNLLDQSDGRCEICKKFPKKRLNIDHCHETGKLRGLLCGYCNKGIGYLQDNVDNLSAAIDYLNATR